MNLKRNYIWLLPLLASLTAPLWWGAAGRLLGPRVTAASPASATSSRQLMNTFVMHQVVLSQSRAGVEELHVKADTVQTGENVEDLQMFGVAGQLIGKRRSLLVSGGKALYDQVRQIFTISDRVKLVSSDGYRLESEVMSYYPRENMIKSDEPVSLTGAGVKMQGDGLEYNLLTGDIRLGGRVVVDFS